MSFHRMVSMSWKTPLRALAVALALALMTALAPSAVAGVDSPTITAPTPRSVHSGMIPVHFAGKTMPGWTIDLADRDKGYVARGVQAHQITGEWTVDVQLAAGSYAVFAIAHDALGHSTAPASGVEFLVDATAPGTRIAAPTDKSVIEPGEPIVVRGDALDNTGIYGVELEYWLLDKRVLVALANCPACGAGGATTASWTHSPDLDPGYYVVRARSADVAGNRSQYAVTTFFASGVDGLPIEKPTLPDENEIQPPVIETPDQDDLIPGTKGPTTIGGDASPGSTVEIVDLENRVIGTTVGDQRTGRWTVRAQLGDGTYTIAARGIDSQGNVSPLSSAVTFTVDGFRPQLDLDTETQTFLPGQPVVLTGAVDDERGVSVIHLDYWLLDRHVLSENAQCLGCPGTHITWTHSPDLDLPGYYTVAVYALDRAGNRSQIGSMSFIKTL